MAEVLQVEARESRGKRNAKRMRSAGQIPAILYGHGKESVSLTLSQEGVRSVLRHGARLVEMTGAVKENAFVKSVQWNAYGTDVLHLDLTRVVKGESVSVTLAVELRGEAPGTRQGGTVEHAIHELTISCPATSIPEKLSVSINELNIGQTITVADIALPEGAKLAVEPDTVVASCVEVVQRDDEEGAAAGDVAEPEVIGRKREDEEGGSE